MKVLIKYAKKNKRFVIETEPSTKVCELKNLIKLNPKVFILNFRLFYYIFPGFKVTLTDSFPLSFFGIRQGSVLEIDSFGPERSTGRKKCKYSTYLDTLGLGVKFVMTDIVLLDVLVEFAKKGDSKSFTFAAEKYLSENSETDILNKTHSNLWSSLHYACFYGSTEIVAYLIAKQVYVNRPTIDLWTPLQLACYMEHIEIVLHLSKHKNLQLNKSTKFRGTGLHLSCEKNNLPLVKLLLSLNAFVLIKDPQGLTPFELTQNQEILNTLAIAAGQEELKRAEEKSLEGLCSKLWHSRVFFIHDRQVILSLDVEKGFLHRYDIETYQSKGKAELSVNLVDIQNVYEESNWFFFNKEEFYFTVETSKSSYRYYGKMGELVREWVKRIKKAVNFFLVHPGEVANELEPDRYQQEQAEQQEMSEGRLYNDGEWNISCFEKLEELGEGSFGTVYKVKLKTTGEIYALKEVSRRVLIKNKQLKYAVSEIKIMKRLKHPFILTLHDSFEDKNSIFMILEYCPNGDLSDLLRLKGKFDMKEAIFYLSEIVLALEYLHSRDIIYRDLKPANILLDSEGHIQLADFGLAKENISNLNLAMTLAGTPAYLSPETLSQQGTSKPADIYGLGVVLYEMLTGKPPFYSSNIEKLLNNIKTGDLHFPVQIRPQAKEFIIATMNKIPEKRPNIHSLRHFPLFYKRDWDSLIHKRIKPPILMQKRVSLGQDDCWEI